MKETERRIYEYIIKQAESGISPSLREICGELGIRSTSTAAKYVNSLSEKGLIEKHDRRSRSVRPAGQSSLKVPLIGKTARGQPFFSAENISGYISFTPREEPVGQLFAVRDGDGSVYIAEYKSEASDGSPAAAEKNGIIEIIKYNSKGNGGHTVIGRAIAVIRYF